MGEVDRRLQEAQRLHEGASQLYLRIVEVDARVQRNLNQDRVLVFFSALLLAVSGALFLATLYR